MKKYIPWLVNLIFAAGMIVGTSCFAQETEMFQYLTDAESARLKLGETIVRTVTSYKKLSLAMEDEFFEEIKNSISQIKPNYITEVISIIPVNDDKNAIIIMEKLTKEISDPAGYIGIPYWSKRQQKTYELFDKMEIISRKAKDAGEEIEVLQHMEPFDNFRVRYKYNSYMFYGSDKTGEAGIRFTFTGVNLDPVIYSYRNIKAIKSGNMVWFLYVFRKGQNLIFYGVGAVNAFDLFGIIRDRLETSFMGRVESFFVYMNGKMKN